MKVNKKKISGGGAEVAYPLFQGEDGGAIPTSPLQMKIVKIKPQLASHLNELWHSKLPKIHWSNITRNTHYICYGALYENKFYAVGIWSSPVAQNRMKEGKITLELRRLAISNDAPKYTASWMIGLMVKMIKKEFPDIVKLISYQDTEVHKGTIYKASNWFAENITKYVAWNKTRIRNNEQSTAKKIRWAYLILI